MRRSSLRRDPWLTFAVAVPMRCPLWTAPKNGREPRFLAQILAQSLSMSQPVCSLEAISETPSSRGSHR